MILELGYPPYHLISNINFFPAHYHICTFWAYYQNMILFCIYEDLGGVRNDCPHIIVFCIFIYGVNKSLTRAFLIDREQCFVNIKIGDEREVTQSRLKLVNVT